MSRTREPHSQYYREKCMVQKLHVCGGCGTTEGRLVTHHINGDGTDNRLENLIPLCDSCHRKVHSILSHGRSIDRLSDQLPPSSFPFAQRKEIVGVEFEDEFVDVVDSVAKELNTGQIQAIRHMCREGGYDV